MEAQNYLNHWYPQSGVCIRENEYRLINNFGKSRVEVIKLNFSKQELEGILNLSDFINLEELNCSYNQLTEIILPVNNKLKIIIIYNNKLKNFNYQSLNPETLIVFLIRNNNLLKTDISVFKNLVNLEFLSIGNDQFYLNFKSDSKLYGSLKAFEKCFKLESLHILDHNSQINRGLEYLSDSTKIYYTSNCKDALIRRILNQYKGNDLLEDLKPWKESNFQLIENAKVITKLTEYEEMSHALKIISLTIKPDNPWRVENQALVEVLLNENQAFHHFWLNPALNITNQLRTENEAYYQQFESNKKDEVVESDKIVESNEINNKFIVEKSIKFFSIIFTIFVLFVGIIIRNRKNKKI